MGIPGGSNPEDRPIHRCNLDNAPSLISDVTDFPSPLYARRTLASLTVVVNPDGRVNRDLTRYWSGGSDEAFGDALMERIRHLEFEVGRSGGAPTRYGNRLEVRMNLRRDSVPEQLSWRYVRGPREDSLVGTWVRVGSDPAPTPGEYSRAVTSITRVLRTMQVLTPQHWHPYCLSFEAPVPRETRARVLAALYEDAPRPLLWDLPPGCESDVTARRYRLGAPTRTGGGRTVVRASGDFLQHWPPGIDQRWWRAWLAYCVVPEGAAGGYGTRCEIIPVRSGDPVADFVDRYIPREEPAEDEPVEFQLEVTTSAAFRTDTLRGSLPHYPGAEPAPTGEPDLRFRFGDLREEARTGGSFFIRLRLDREIDELAPYVLAKHLGRTFRYSLSRVDDREFGISVHTTPPFSDETEFEVYLTSATGGEPRG